MFLRNCWYAAAYAGEIGPGETLGRTLLGEPVALFRTAAGDAAALEDRCCHRHLPLSLGAVEGERLRCGYHGLAFDASGECVEVPGQSRVPPGAAVRSYPLVEQDGFLWIWMGEAEHANPVLIPDWWWTGHPGWDFNPGPVLHVACNYELITDNLLDLSHLGYVHARTLGTDDIVDFPARTERVGDTVRMIRWIQDRPPPPLFKAAGRIEGNVDRWQIVETTPPGHTVVFAGCGPVAAGAPGGGAEYEEGLHVRALNAPTPETETSSFYFYGHAWDFRVGDEALRREMRDGFQQTFLEDAEILAAQQRSIDRDPSAPWIDINVDAPGLAARRALARRVAAEQAAMAG